MSRPSAPPALLWPLPEAVPAAGSRGDARIALIVQRDALAATECDRVLGWADSAAWDDALPERPAPGLRRGRVAWLLPQPDNHWLFDRIAGLLAAGAAQMGVDARGLVEPLQLVRYGPGDYLNWHIDTLDLPDSVRKVSITIQLSPPQTYSGGRLQSFLQRRATWPTERGTALVFPSFVVHRVQPVRSGLRTALVGWAYGPPWK